jgi:hypothetical protein
MKSTPAGNLSQAQRFAQFHGGGIMCLFSQLNDLYFFGHGEVLRCWKNDRGRDQDGKRG